MTDRPPAPTDHRERLQNALLAIQRLQARVAALEGARREPIAIIGLACRFPGGAAGPEAFWRLLANGVDAITEIPPERWPIDDHYDPDPEAPGKSYSRWGGFLDQVDRFDPGFFGISPREAAVIDPQQRLLLETAWAALENAGTAPGSLGGSRTGVFVGITGSDYAQLVRAAGPEQLNAYSATGSTSAFAAGRVSYVLGLEGPSVAVDTACSSSLSAVHQAVQSLRSGDCEMAIAGGVNLMLTPEMYVTTSRNRMLSPTGRCHTFDTAADGFVRGEGCGVVVLKRLSDAERDGDPILAVIRGSAMNQDGATSGMTVPNRHAQEALIRAALEDAGVEPREVGYVEAHGTGTALGDPIEMRALGAVFAGRAAEAPLYVGSVKTNLGHLEAGSGIAGLIKTVLMLVHEEIPPHLNFREPSPHIPWAELAVAVPTARLPWPRGGVRRIAGVSAFGASGTNIHLVLEEAPALAPRPAAAPERPLHLLPLSARTDADLRALATAFRDHLRDAPADALGDVCHTAAVGRTHFAHRLAVVGATPAQMAERLDAFLAGEEVAGLVTGVARPGVPPKLAFLFTGQGSQYVGMGRELYESEPVFREALERCDQLLRPHLERPLLAVLYPDAGEEAEAEQLLRQTGYTQPALFALEYALAELWRSWGIEPAALLGHSVGEYVAACLAGVFSLEEGLELIATRARLMQQLPAGGAMAAVRAPEPLVAEAIAPHTASVALAAVNGPESVVITGAAAEVERIVAALRARGIDCKPLAVSHAFHSPLLEPVLDALEAAARRIALEPPRLPLISNLTGETAGAELTYPAYWRRHAREPVRFAQGMRTLEEHGIDAFVEIGPHPVLLGMGRENVSSAPLWLPSLRRGRRDTEQALGALARLYAAGAPIDWAGFDAGRARRKVWLPTYPFQGGRHWIDTRPAAPSSPRRADGAHPLLGAPLRAAGRQRIFEARLGTTTPAYLADHRVRGAVVLPAAAYLEMALAAAETALGAPASEIEDVVLHAPLGLADDEPITVQTVLVPDGEGAARFEIHSLWGDGVNDEWRLHASGTVRARAGGAPSPADAPIAALEAALPEAIPAAVHYEALAARGLDFGETFRGVLRVRRGERTALATVRLPGALDGASAYRMPPPLLDACLQAVGAALDAPAGATYLPLGFARVRINDRLDGELRSHATLHSAAAGAEGITADVRIYGDDGQLLVEIDGIALRPLRESALSGASGDIDGWLYDVVWEEQPLRGAAADASAAPPLATLLAPVRAYAAALATGPDAALLRDLAAELDQLSAAYAATALRALGLPLAAGEAIATEGLRARLCVEPRYERLLARLLEILAEDGVLEPAAGGWRVVRAPDAAELEARLAELRVRHPESAAELAILERCGAALASALRGERDPLELLFPGGSMADVERMYRDSPLTRGYNALVAEAVAAIAGSNVGRPLRVLEIGGGTGGTTAYVLPLLPAERTEYLFTDVSAVFTERAKQRFAGYGFVRTQTLDIARGPGEQGVPPGGFDLIVASNVLHATPDLRATLGRVRELLAPGGALVLLEGVARHRFADLTVGLTDGWWSFADAELRSYALIDAGRWLALLGDAGLEAQAVTGAAPFTQQAVFVARAPAETPHTAAQAGSSWLILADEAGVGGEVAVRLRARGGTCVLVRPADAAAAEGAALDAGVRRIDPMDPAAFQELVHETTAAGTRPLRGVVHLWALDEDAGAGAALGAAQARVTGSALHLVQALAAAGAAPRLWLVTRGAQATEPGEPVSPLHAPIWGLGKVVALEHPELGCVRIDLDAVEGPASSAEALLAELEEAGDEDQVALRAGRRYVARLARRGTAAPAGALALPGAAPYELCSAGEKTLDALELRPLVRRAPGAGEVEVEVVATGLAFRDVLNALGRYPGPEAPLGGEFAGVVSAVGEGVEAIAIGDAVVGMAPGAFRSFVTARAELVAPKPAGLSFVEAASLPSAFLTAHYALHHLARLRPGERVLIHAAAGGVGLAAVRLAQRAGAEIFASAGSEPKREHLRALGIPHVYDSRSLDFAEQLLEATGGAGVDVVLNSLAGDFIAASFACLAERGRFVEIGKRDAWTAEEAAAVRPYAAYHAVDLAAAADGRPELIRTLFREVLAEIAAGTLRPLPVKTFPVTDAPAAFRYMAQARHTGKIVLVHARAPVVRADATYLITGGLGGVGLETARWLVERGVRHLVLVGRSAPGDAARAAVARLEQAGAQVVVARADVSRAAEVERVLATIGETMPLLRGVFHGALVLDDGALVQQSWERFEHVFAPRVRGAWLLHALTRELPLDLFVLHSAAGAVLGSAGQANYTAANAFLDALAHHRRSLGMPALSVQWGAWAEVGRAAELGVDGHALGRGIGAMPTRQALAALERVLGQIDAPPQVAVTPVDWRAFLDAAGARGGSPFFTRLAAEVRRATAARPAGTDAQPESPPPAAPRRSLRDELAEAPPARRRAVLAAHVRAQVVKVLSLEADHPLDPQQPLQELGLDSLMAVELRTLLGSGLARERGLPATLAFDYPTAEALTGFLLRELFGDSGAADPSPAGADDPSAPDSLDADLDALTDDEAEALLLAELDELRSLNR